MQARMRYSLIIPAVLGFAAGLLSLGQGSVKGADPVVSRAPQWQEIERYLVARYGVRPAIRLLGGDGPASDPAIVAQLDRAGRMIETWDAYQQLPPTRERLRSRVSGRK